MISTNLLDFGADRLQIAVLNANVGSSWSHRATAAALAAGALLTLVRALRSSSLRAWWSGTAVILGLLFVAEASPLHVQVDRASFGKLIYAPLLAGLVVCLWRLAGASNQKRLMRVGLGALFLSYAIHIFGMAIMHALSWGPDSWGYQTRAALKEGTELSGWLLVVLALWRLR
ncbi:MAG: hypothetical protein JO372_11695, partial [Solirubrobacterales bacterium]|nr:hypothetical protein [Solirubrobacterales bacterium]